MYNWRRLLAILILCTTLNLVENISNADISYLPKNNHTLKLQTVNGPFYVNDKKVHKFWEDASVSVKNSFHTRIGKQKCMQSRLTISSSFRNNMHNAENGQTNKKSGTRQGLIMTKVQTLVNIQAGLKALILWHIYRIPPLLCTKSLLEQCSSVSNGAVNSRYCQNGYHSLFAESNNLTAVSQYI
jgi:hypothetical protein